MTTTSYRAVQASKPGRLEVVERELTGPPPGKLPGPCQHLFTVSLVTRYVEGKLGQAQDGAPLAQGLHRLQPAQREGLAGADPVVVDERIGRRP